MSVSRKPRFRRPWRTNKKDRKLKRSEEGLKAARLGNTVQDLNAEGVRYMVVQTRVEEIFLGGDGYGQIPIDMAWERVLSVTPFAPDASAVWRSGIVSLAEFDGVSHVTVAGGPANTALQVLIRTLDDAAEADVEMATGCPASEEADDLEHHGSGDSGEELALSPGDEDVGPESGKHEPTPEESQAAAQEEQQSPAQDEPEPSEAELAIDAFLDGKDDLQRTEGEELAPVYWPRNDDNAPDYRHLTDFESDEEFELTAADIDTLIKANRFKPEGNGNRIAPALRGSRLQSGNEQERASGIGLVDLRPNHVDFHCTLGFYFMGDSRLTLFTGSTVPAVYYMEEYYKRMNGLPHSYGGGANMLPTGCYVFRVGRHTTLRPALRMSDPDNLARDGRATVLRTRNDLAYGTADFWDKTRPFDNVHCSYFLNVSRRHKARFSSAGCLTVRGRKAPSHQWAKFQDVLNSIGNGKRCDLLLLTGRECAIAAKLREQGLAGDAATLKRELVRLRVGSQGGEVTRLQRKLGFSGSGYFGPSTKTALTRFQRAEGIPADGVYSPVLDRELGWGVFT